MKVIYNNKILVDDPQIDVKDKKIYLFRDATKDSSSTIDWYQNDDSIILGTKEKEPLVIYVMQGYIDIFYFINPAWNSLSNNIVYKRNDYDVVKMLAYIINE